MIDLTWEEVNALVLKARETERELIHKAFGDYYLHSCSQDFPQAEGQMCHLCNMHRLIKGEASQNVSVEIDNMSGEEQ